MSLQETNRLFDLEIIRPTGEKEVIKNCTFARYVNEEKEAFEIRWASFDDAVHGRTSSIEELNTMRQILAVQGRSLSRCAVVRIVR